MRLPVPSQDKNSWGEILNSWLRVAHNDDGTLTDAVKDNITAGLAQEADLVALTATVDAATDRIANLPELNVKDFGAVGDGVTAYETETAAIQSAIDTADGTRVVVIPKGTYDVGQLNNTVASKVMIRLEEGAILRKRGGAHSESMFNFTGDTLIIRGPGTIDGNWQNNFNPTTFVHGRPAMVSGNCEEGKTVDIQGVHFDNIMQGVRLTLFGGYLNFTGNTVTNHGQHTQQTGGNTSVVFIASGDVDAVSPLIRTNFNTMSFTATEDAAGTAPGGFFVCTSDVNGGGTKSVGNPAKWEAIGNYFYGYGQNKNSNEIGCLHSYPSPAQMRVIGNHFEHFPVTPINAKSVTDFVCMGNTFLNDIVTSTYVPHAGTILYAPGYWSDEAEVAVQHFRAVIANNIIDNTGGNATQGAYGIVVNSVALSHARNLVITGNSVSVNGNAVYLSYVKNAIVSSNLLSTVADGTSVQRRGIELANTQGDIKITNNLMDVRQQGVSAVVTSNTAGRVFVEGNSIKSAGSACVDLRGLLYARITGNTVERAGGSTAINVTTDGSTPLAKLFYDRTNHVLEGTVVLSHANITTMEGEEPLAAVPTIVANTGAGTGPTVSMAGDGDKGTISITTGTTPATGSLATITLATARRAAPIVMLQAANSATKAAEPRVYVSTVTTSTIVLTVQTTALTASTAYLWRYWIL